MAAMRTNGVAERLCTGDASDRENLTPGRRLFRTLSATRYTTDAPRTAPSVWYHWQIAFSVNADEIWNECNELLAQDNFSAPASCSR